MKNFWRVIRFALHYKSTVALSFVCSLMVALLWGGNISAVFPFVNVVIANQSLQTWVTNEITECETNVAQLQAELVQLQAGPAAGMDQDQWQRRKAELPGLAEAEAKAAEKYRSIQPYVDKYLPNDPFSTLVLLVVMLLVGTLVKNLFFFINSMQENQLAQLAVFDLSKLFFRRTLRMDLASFSDEGAAQLMSRFTYDMDCVAGGLRSLFGKCVREPLKMIACLIGAAVVCPRLLILSLLIAPLAAYVIARLGKLLKRANRRAMEEMSLIYGILEESFQGIKVVKAFTMERYERLRFHKKSKTYLDRALRIGKYDALTRPLSELMGISTVCMALLAGVYLVLKKETTLFGITMCSRPLDLSELLLFYGMLAGISDPARKLSEVFGRLQRAAAASDRIFSLLDREPVIRDPEPKLAVPFERHERDLRLENICFSYQAGHPILQDINLRVQFGETLAIVGPNGCGKSTLVNLIPRFFDADSGNILIDGINVKDCRLRDLRSQIGLVTQEPVLFDATVFENIAYGSQGVSREMVLNAAKRAHAHKFIEEQLPLGYNTQIGPGGVRLSGGQRQRLALARAILRDPSILILDEATSQVDLESEQLIHQVLQEFKRDRTTLIITHRLSTLALANRVLVLNRGAIVGLGTHQELMRTCDTYRRLHEMQFKQVA